MLCEPKGTVVTTRPSGRPVGAEDMTERAGCHLILTPELRQVLSLQRRRRGVDGILELTQVSRFLTLLHICELFLFVNQII